MQSWGVSCVHCIQPYHHHPFQFSDFSLYCEKKRSYPASTLLNININMTDTHLPPNVSCFSHIHTLPFFLESSSHVSHQTTSSHTLSHTYTPTTFQTQTSHHSPHPSILPGFQPDTPLPLHQASTIFHLSNFLLTLIRFKYFLNPIQFFSGCIDFWNHILTKKNVFFVFLGFGCIAFNVRI